MCANWNEPKGGKVMVRLKATDLDVYVDGKCVGSVCDCGDCWRICVLGRRKRRGYNLDFDTRGQAVSGLVSIVTAP
jgi:hypothetical protein